MDLLSSIRKSGSRGGVNFSWDDVQTSQHRENYLGHSLMAPVGRWQKGRDLSWYAKADDESNSNETAEERRARERKEEIRRIKEAEEDALARALGLPVPERNGAGTGANNIDVGEMRRVIKETGAGDDEIDEVGKAKGFGDFRNQLSNQRRVVYCGDLKEMIEDPEDTEKGAEMAGAEAEVGRGSIEDSGIGQEAGTDIGIGEGMVNGLRGGNEVVLLIGKKGGTGAVATTDIGRDGTINCLEETGIEDHIAANHRMLDVQTEAMPGVDICFLGY
ncbi:hypothetical protein BP5796_00042 [Coleophoma crateriformis]|uniref:Multiple myeloma tumor-associated protein 2-like N-terminal domain-containing protein n=1 Tax=Coleophoma crateriformis TaxID=565419 RepID=A0A3D8T6W6_9HELO|nr:hypothetical protein BP5796_00042 [Coleophoma crateriformis]